MMFTTVKPNLHKTVAFSPNFHPFVNHFFNDAPATAKTFQPAVNIIEKENDYVIEVAAPGFQKEDFNLKIEKDLLTISAQKETQKAEGDKVIRREFNFVQFERTFHLTEKINSESIAANYENGILTVALAKKEEVKPEVRTISVA
jgi:HSP20 family protein